jgi:cobyrinic acid a,c-diamide synthase
VKGLVVAGTGSGAGKTSLTLSILAALKRRGIRVRAFKVGPDFIDPGLHALASGSPSHNLDGWMLPAPENRAIFARHAADAEVALVEGVMGLYDGANPTDEAGSTAQMAKLLGLPVLLVVNAEAMVRSLAALALGFERFDPELSWMGLVANNLGSPDHRRLLARAMEPAARMPFVGGLLKQEDIVLAERHLGLVTAEEGGLGPEELDRLADWLEEGLDLDALLQRLPQVDLPALEPDLPLKGNRARLGVARDRAFCFYYQENLRRLEEAGAELVFFSPLADSALPPALQGLYLGGGYPELYAEQLAMNSGLARQIARAGRRGLPIYAECGGMMYLGRELVDTRGRAWPMCGLLPHSTRMLSGLRSLGYREVEFSGRTPLGPAGALARGHEFHYSEMIEPPEGGAYAVAGGAEAGQARGILQGNTLASYVHLHFGSNPELAVNLVAACRQRGPA